MGLVNFKEMFNKDNLGNTIGTLGSAAASAANGVTGLDSTAGNVLSSLGSVAGSIHPLLGAGLQTAGVFANLAFGSKINDANVAKVQDNLNQMKSFESSASDTTGLLNEAKNMPSAMSFNQDFIGKDGLFSNKAKNKYNELKAGVAEASDRSSRNLLANASNISTDKAMGLQRQQIFDFGGQLSTNGTLFDSPMYEINAGGTHETNPNGGVPIKIDPMTGEPQLAEEGEAVYDQFVFSNNPNLPLFEDTKKGLNLSRKAKTYADAAKEINADVSEMPNDMLARKTAAIRLSALAQTQEQIKQALEAEGYNQEEQLMM